MHIVDTLRGDHERMAALVQRMRQSTDGSADRRGQLRQALASVLGAHATFKEKVFYPALREAGDDVTREVAEAINSQQEAEEMLEEMSRMDPASAEFTATLARVESAVETQIRREESEIFPIALRVIDSYAAEEMSERHDAMARGPA